MRLLACLFAGLLAACAPAPKHQTKGPPARIVSLDFCVDQYVLELADRSSIAALSRDADQDVSFLRDQAKGVRKLGTHLEDVLVPTPDLVVRAHGGGPRAAALLQSAGIPVVQLEFADTFDAVRSNLRTLAAALGRPERGEAIIRRMDTELAEAKAAPRKGKSLLYISAGGATTGPGTLVNDLILAAGYDNFARGPGWRSLPLEDLAYRQPDVVAVSFFGARAQAQDDWSSARHPVVQNLVKTLPTIQLDNSWTACGGWFALEAVRAMRAGAS